MLESKNGKKGNINFKRLTNDQKMEKNATILKNCITDLYKQFLKTDECAGSYIDEEVAPSDAWALGAFVDRWSTIGNCRTSKMLWPFRPKRIAKTSNRYHYGSLRV